MIERIVFVHAIVFVSAIISHAHSLSHYINCDSNCSDFARSFVLFLFFCRTLTKAHKRTYARAPFLCHKIEFFAWFAFDWFLSAAAAVVVVVVDIDVFLLLLFLCDALVSCLFWVFFFVFFVVVDAFGGTPLLYYNTQLRSELNCTFCFCLLNHTNNTNPFSKSQQKYTKCSIHIVTYGTRRLVLQWMQIWNSSILLLHRIHWNTKLITFTFLGKSNAALRFSIESIIVSTNIHSFIFYLSLR